MFGCKQNELCSLLVILIVFIPLAIIWKEHYLKGENYAKFTFLSFLDIQIGFCCAYTSNVSRDNVSCFYIYKIIQDFSKMTNSSSSLLFNVLLESSRLVASQPTVDLILHHLPRIRKQIFFVKTSNASFPDLVLTFSVS